MICMEKVVLFVFIIWFKRANVCDSFLVLTPCFLSVCVCVVVVLRGHGKTIGIVNTDRQFVVIFNKFHKFNMEKSFVRGLSF